jgi:hypothetical protein
MSRESFIEGTLPMLRLTTTLTPARDIRVTAAPRDLAIFDRRLDLYHGEGRLFTCQTGNSAAQAFFSPLGNEGATVFYFQNLSGLADYFNQRSQTGRVRRRGIARGGLQPSLQGEASQGVSPGSHRRSFRGRGGRAPQARGRRGTDVSGFAGANLPSAAAAAVEIPGLAGTG